MISLKMIRSLLAALLAMAAVEASATTIIDGYVLEPGHPSLQVWLLPEAPPHPTDNVPT